MCHCFTIVMVPCPLPLQPPCLPAARLSLRHSDGDLSPGTMNHSEAFLLHAALIMVFSHGYRKSLPWQAYGHLYVAAEEMEANSTATFLRLQSYRTKLARRLKPVLLTPHYCVPKPVGKREADKGCGPAPGAGGVSSQQECLLARNPRGDYELRSEGEWQADFGGLPYWKVASKFKQLDDGDSLYLTQ